MQSLHVAFLAFAASALASRNDPPTIEIQGPYLTSKWFDNSSVDDLIQVIEFTIYNSHQYNYLTLADTLNITVQSDSLEIVIPTSYERLAPQQSAVVQVGVRNLPNTPRGSQCSGTLVATYGQGYGPVQTATGGFSGTCGIPDYTEDSDLSFHWDPDWFNEVKFGIFIHWGVYSVPAYGSVSPNEDYAEWYWCRMHDPNWKTDTYQWHEEHYGEDFNYDQFLESFTAAAYDPKGWVDLIAEAGARYMVPVTKHHEGWVTFNTSTTNRSFFSMGPKRDLLGELLDAAKTYHPEIRRGTYFSLPEWYNPAFAPYRNSNPSFGGGCFGFPDINPYTNESVEYTGYIPVNDFIEDVQLPQMNELAYNYDSDIMWCDIQGTPNNSTIMLSAWFNWAREQGRQVTYNQRCGPAGDFDTPEYTTNSGIVGKKWETNRGMDPFSFGYNAQTPDDQYLTGEDIVQTLVDTISKNGNFLLDIGPTGNGSIPDIMSSGLKDAGSWIIPHGDGIYSTRFWNQGPGLGNFRYTVKDSAFYIFYLEQPPAILDFTDPIPWLPGDTVTALGGNANGTVIDAYRDSNGFHLNIPQEVIDGDKYVWAFKVSYTSDW